MQGSGNDGGKKELYKMKRDDTLKIKSNCKYRIVNFHKDILGENLGSLRLYSRTVKDN